MLSVADRGVNDLTQYPVMPWVITQVNLSCSLVGINVFGGSSINLSYTTMP